MKAVRDAVVRKVCRREVEFELWREVADAVCDAVDTKVLDEVRREVASEFYREVRFPVFQPLHRAVSEEVET